ncbi:SDR family oxidoreductase [Tateyamaria pelophila]|uniref:SDR family oxidoreductase n=1 Tax=Tateyamaria pelophila TaxID=328415 RepID=UPI001CBC66E0|nr:SDR family NAD(P)-dependent oxidoreductase [Tateyamaria pelophila]
MDLREKIIVVTGAAAGIGRALCLAFAEQGAKSIVCVDLDLSGAKETASLVNGLPLKVDVAKEDEIARMIAQVEADLGPIDLFCSNAGVLTEGGVEVSNADWQKLWEINVMSHVWAARHLLPRMVARGGGYLLNTASAAGLLNQIGSAPYGVTKHAAVGLAEWLAMTHGDDGIKVSVLCPQAVRTAMTEGHEDHVAALDGMLEPADAAQACIEAIRTETFLVLPHPSVLEYMRLKTADYDRWIGGMRKLNRRFGGL